MTVGQANFDSNYYRTIIAKHQYLEWKNSLSNLAYFLEPDESLWIITQHLRVTAGQAESGMAN